MLDRLESAVNQIKRFTADASHELRGPLSFTRTVAEIALKNPQADPESRQALQEIVDETAKAAILLEDMLTLARADSLPVTLTADRGEPYRRARGSLQHSATHRESSRASVWCVRRRERSAIVLGDASALKRLIWILLDNALKYSKPNGRTAVSLGLIEGRAQIVVSDDGIGIPAAALPFIFDRFFRADPSRGMVEGNGLGLAIAKWIVETHQG